MRLSQNLFSLNSTPNVLNHLTTSSALVSTIIFCVIYKASFLRLCIDKLFCTGIWSIFPSIETHVFAVQKIILKHVVVSTEICARHVAFTSLTKRRIPVHAYASAPAGGAHEPFLSNVYIQCKRSCSGILICLKTKYNMQNAWASTLSWLAVASMSCHVVMKRNDCNGQ